MRKGLKNPGKLLLGVWQRSSGTAFGRWIFNRILGLLVPYSGSIRARVRQLEPGHSKVELPDRRAVRNHLASIHAIALANLCELTSGLAVLTSLPSDCRGILTGFSVVYLKKARGTLTAECRVPKISSSETREFKVAVEARDSSGDAVVRAEAQWKIGPEK